MILRAVHAILFAILFVSLAFGLYVVATTVLGVPLFGASACQTPVLDTDGVTLPADDPCRGAPIVAIPDSTWMLGLNDNIPGEYSDDDFQDWLGLLYFNLDGVLWFVERLGGVSSQTVIPEIFPFVRNQELSIDMLDLTAGQRWTYRDPQIGWAQRQVSEVPEPGALWLVLFGAALVLLRRARC